MIVSFPEEAAAATCRSILLLIFALSCLCRAALFTAAAFLGGMNRLPFFGADAAFAAWRDEEAFDFWRPLEEPWTISNVGWVV